MRLKEGLKIMAKEIAKVYKSRFAYCRVTVAPGTVSSTGDRVINRAILRRFNDYN